MKIPPDPDYIYAIKNQNMVWREALGELVDNGFDAGATRVSIEFVGKERLVVRDDGGGASDVGKMLTLGAHKRGSHTKLGRYGVGLKDAAIWLAKGLLIQTTRGGVLRSCRVDWDELAKTPDWEIPDPLEEPSPNLAGTELFFDGLRRSPPDYKALLDDLGFIFMPALRSGLQIIVRPSRGASVVVKPYELPPLEEVVEDDFQVHGKGVKLRAGIVRSGHKNRRPGFVFLHEFRVIFSGSLGAKDHGISQIAGIVELDRKWALSKNKSELTDTDREPLGEAIFERCRAMLEKAQERATDLELECLTTKAEALLSGSLRAVVGKEKRARRGEHGKSTPKNTEAKRVNVSRIQDGVKRLRAIASSVKLEWARMGNGDKLGEPYLDPPRIVLNRDHPLLEHFRVSENAEAVAVLALTLLAHKDFDREQGCRFPFARNYQSVPEALGPLLASWRCDEQKDARARASA